MSLSKLLSALTLLVLGGASGRVFAADLPDSRVNPQTTFIEIVDPVWNLTNHDVNFVVTTADGSQDVFAVTTNPADDLAPRLDGDPNGESWVVWWRDLVLDQVLIRHHRADGSWAPERLVSNPLMSSKNPDVVRDGIRTFVAFERASLTGQVICGAIITDEPDPIGLHDQLAVTSYGGNRDVRVHAVSNHVWITWVHSCTLVGWVEYHAASNTWTAPIFESYALDNVRQARDRIRAMVLGN